LWKLNDVIAVEYRHDFTYRITFDDGLEGDVDLAEFVEGGPVFEPLRDPEFFRRARVEGGTICWPNGADIAPEVLYERVESALAERDVMVVADKPAASKP
jgi:hypothetical protein